MLLNPPRVIFNAVAASVLQFSIMHCVASASGTLPSHGNDFAVGFFTVHVGLVVYASADAVLGMAITIKGRGNVTDSPSMRPECKVER